MKKWITALLTLASINTFALTADQIVDKANQASYYAGNDGSADVKMTITEPNGKARTREFRILRKNTDGGNQKFYVYFKAPADVHQQVFLVWKNVGQGKNDDRWLFLPDLNLVKPIAPGDKRTSFVGSDFVYEDVSGRALWEDWHKLTGETDTQYVIKNTPINPGAVEFSYYNVWIDKDTFLPRKAEYYDKEGVLYRRVEATKVETVQGFPTVTESKVSDLEDGSTTVDTFSNIQYNIGLNEQLFTERFLRRSPREATR
ncbi:MAG: outer membrane lipoprotein-sorting protein [Kiritimatiellales bacterium]